MTCGDAINARLKDLSITKIKLATDLNTTKQNIANKFARNNFSTDELIDICGVLGLKLALIDADNQEVKYIIDTKPARKIKSTIE